MPHGFDNPKTRALLVQHKLDTLSPNALITLFRKLLKDKVSSSSHPASNLTETLFSYLVSRGEECRLDIPSVVKRLQMLTGDKSYDQRKVLDLVDSSPEKFEVKTVGGKQFVKAKTSLKLCELFEENKCRVRPCCKDLHICRHFLLGKCLSSGICKMPHGFDSPETRTLLEQHKLDILSPNVLKTLFRNTLRDHKVHVRVSSTSGPNEAMFSCLIYFGNECRLDIPSAVKQLQTWTGDKSYDQIKVLDLVSSSPEKFEVKIVDGKQFVEAKSSLKLCDQFQGRRCKVRPCSKGLHICRRYLLGKCSSPKKCKTPHGFGSPDTRALLAQHKLDNLSPNVLKTLFRSTLRDYKVHAAYTSGPILCDSAPSGKLTAAKRSSPTEAMFSYLISHGVECRLDIASVVKLLQAFTVDESYDQRKVLELVNSSPENFEVKTVDGKQFVEAKSSLKLCEVYQDPVGYCWSRPCKGLHVCRHFLRGSGECLAGDECEQPHSFDSPETRALLVQHKLYNLSPDDLITLFRKVFKESKYKVHASSTSDLSASRVYSEGDFASDSNPKGTKPKAGKPKGAKPKADKPKADKRSSPTQSMPNFPTAPSSHVGCAATAASGQGHHKLDNVSPNVLKVHTSSTPGPILAASSGKSIAAMRSRLSEAMFSYLISHGEECRMDIASAVKHLQMLTGDKSYDQIKVLDLVNSSPEKFEVNTVGGKQFLKAKTSLKLCELFEENKCWVRPCCKDLHICRHFLLEKCLSADKCRMPHGFESPETRALLQQHKLDNLSPNGLKTLFQNTLGEYPKVDASSTSGPILISASSGKSIAANRSSPTEAMFSHLISHGEKCRLDIRSVVKHLQALAGTKSYDQRKVLELANSSPKKFKMKTVDGKQFIKAKSSLKLCEVHQDPEGCCTSPCKGLHICRQYLLGKCSSAKKCKMPHGFGNPEMKDLLVQHQLDKLSPNALKMLFRSSLRKHKVRASSTSGPWLGDSASRRKPTLAMRSKLIEAMFSYLISHGEECRLDIPSVVKHLQALTGDESYDQRKVLELVSFFPEKFEVESIDGEQFVEAKSPLKLCEAYQDPAQWCSDRPCNGLHICRHFLIGSCWAGDKCKRPHGFDNPKTKALLVEHNLDSLSPDDLITLFRKVFKERKYKVQAPSTSGPAKRSPTEAMFSYLIQHGKKCRLDISSVVKHLQTSTGDESYDQRKVWDLVNSSPEIFEVKHIGGKKFVEAKSSLKLCHQFQRGRCWLRPCEKGLHICLQYLLGKCSTGTCEMPHGFGQPETRALLEQHKLDNLPPYALKTLFRSTFRELMKGYNVHAMYTPSEAMFSYLISHGEECRMDILSIAKFLQKVSCDKSYDQNKVLELVNFFPEQFEVETVDGKQFVETKSSLKLCNQFQEGKCRDVSCKSLHICPSFLEDDCQLGDECKKPHGFNNPRARALLVHYKLNDLSSDALNTVFRKVFKERKDKASNTSGPSISRVHNKGDCNLASTTKATPNLPTAASSHVGSAASAASASTGLHTHIDGDQQNDRFQTNRDVHNRKRSAKYLKYVDEITMRQGLDE